MKYWDAYLDGEFLGTFDDRLSAIEAIGDALPGDMSEARIEEFLNRLEANNYYYLENDTYIEESPFSPEYDAPLWDASDDIFFHYMER